MQKQAPIRAPRAAPVAAPTQPAERPALSRKLPMMRQYDLIERVRRYNPDTNEALLNRAYVYAMKAHGEQRRASGDPYFSHPIEVAAILTDLKLDDATIAAALLHDTIEDTEATRAEIDSLFGRDIGTLVEGLTKLKKLDLVTKEAKQAENLRKLLLAIADDVRVLLIKLADRLHNMRTLGYRPPEARRRVAEETLDIYAPLAGRMGMHEMREELDDLAFRELYPEAYDVVTARLNALTERSKLLISEIEKQLAKKLADRGIDARVVGRRKRAYSIWRKMERKSVGFEQLSDIFGFRVIVKTLPDCYQALGVVHSTWPMVPGRFKDYISTPKGNDYRSIHTTVIGPSKQRVELQIRTVAMHEIAEYGIAAHALYASRPPMPGYGAPSSCWRKARTRKNSSSTRSSNYFTTRCSVSRPRASSLHCLARRPRSISPMRCTPTSATPRSVARSTARSRRSRPNSSTATRSRSPARKRRRLRPPPGNRLSSPARRARRSGAPPVPPCAGNMPGLAGALSSASSSARKSHTRMKI
jgi:GTP diphosphokinase / guanosine-3',5'-bis(diphosphate) 3'-diphosphatase